MGHVVFKIKGYFYINIYNIKFLYSQRKEAIKSENLDVLDFWNKLLVLIM